jgi:plasmid stability protein
MVFHMKTTLNIDDSVMKRLKQEAARRGRTMSELVEDALRLFLQHRKIPGPQAARLPSFHGGEELVDIADREALYRAMEEA